MHYTLENAELVVTFDSLGGQLTSIKNRSGLEYLWQGDPAYWAGQAPILFPICGGLRDGKAVNQEGEAITLNRHGLIRKREFVCESQTETDIIFSIKSDAEMLAAYPYAFAFYVRYQLVGNSVHVQYRVVNESDRVMPFFVGGHPAFKCPLEEGLAFTDYTVTFDKQEETSLVRPDVTSGLLDRENLMHLDFDGQKLPLSHDLFREDALCFKNARSSSVTLSSTKSLHSVTLIREDFPNVLIWSSNNDGPFVALEPMLGLSTFLDESDVFEEKDQLQTVAPGEVAVYRYRLVYT